MDTFLDVQITNAFFANNVLTIGLNDGRIIHFPCTSMTWLSDATPERQKDYAIESDGYGVWWNELDDGIALHHILSPSPATLNRAIPQPT